MTTSSGARWTKDETILALDLYFRVKDENSTERDSEIGEHLILLTSLGLPDRSTASIVMKMGNFASLDCENHIDGLGNVGPLDTPVWYQFANYPVALRTEVQRIKRGWD